MKPAPTAETVLPNVAESTALLPEDEAASILLKHNPMRYAALVENVRGYAIFLLNPEGHIQTWNLGAQLITGWQKQEKIGQHYRCLFVERDQNQHAPEKNLAFAARNQHLREEQNRRTQAGHALEVLCTIDVLRHAQSGLIQGYLEVFQDITEQKERERALILQATCDSLTGLYNRGFFNEEAQKELLRSQHRYPVTLVMIDLDHFKKINDTYGHEAGDLVLTEFSALLKKRCQPGDVLARLGGEELVWLMPHANKGVATERANQLRLALASKEFQSQQHRFRVSASMGVASYGAHTRGLKELLRNADAALYQAKREGRNRVCAWFE